MSAEQVKLTKAQREVLTDLLKGEAFFRHASVLDLCRAGLVKSTRPAPRRVGQYPRGWYEITAAGRAALAGDRS